MIDLRGLRIGNYALFASGSEFIVRKVAGIEPCGDSFAIRGEKYVDDEYLCTYDLCDRINPIPLTEDILLKCGFENFGFGIFNIPTSDSCDEFFSIQGGFCFLTGCVFNTKKVEYLHQLQNVIFDLYGKELNVQL